MPLAPTVVLGGTAEGNPAGTLGNPAFSMGGTVIETQTAADSVTLAQMQATAASTNFYQTVNLFIGELCRVYSIRPLAAMQRTIDILSNMREQAYL